MDWTTIIVGLLSGTSLAGVVEAIRYRRENRKVKAAEATTADTEAQEKQINLAELYMQKVLKMTESLSASSSENQKQTMEKLDMLDCRLEKVEIQTANMEEYLNGNYHEWLAEKEKGRE